MGNVLFFTTTICSPVKNKICLKAVMTFKTLSEDLRDNVIQKKENGQSY